MSLLKIENLSCHFLPEQAEMTSILRNINLKINRQETTALLQLSGNSTSALLQIMAEKMPYNEGILTLKTTPQPQHFSDNSEIRLLVPSLLAPEATHLTVEQYLFQQSQRPTGFLSIFKKSSTPDLRHFLKELDIEPAENINKPINELPAAQVVLLSLLPTLADKPQLLLIDTLSSIVPEHIIGQTLALLKPICTTMSTTLIFSTRSPQLAHQIGHHLCIFQNEYLVQEMDNNTEDPNLLETLFQLIDKANNEPISTPTLKNLIEKQYI